ncbi:MAG: hypothetical protein A07HR60_01380 [uncultured archaeon A07HR60]|nr:MAG: hypothetical protein A07HR60_01380 [uncultured archaeon A07HR60]
MADVEAELRSFGVSVESVEPGDPLFLAYLTAHPGKEIDHSEMGRALNGLIDLAETGQWEPVRVDAAVLRAPGDRLGTWHAEPEWFRALGRYEITETEFSTRVLDTIELHKETDSAADHSGEESNDI